MRTLTFAIVFVVALLVSSAPASAQTGIKNPAGITFTCADHDLDSLAGYEVDFIRNVDKVLVQTVSVAKSATTKLPTGEISVSLNVQPVEFGQYTFVVRAVGASNGVTVRSPNSDPSDVWDRAPGKPGKPRAQ